MKKDFKRFILTWVILFIAVELIMNFFGIGKKAEPVVEPKLTGGIVISTNNDSFTFGKNVIVSVKNLKESDLEMAQTKCTIPFEVFHYNQMGTWEKIEINELDCIEEKVAPMVIKPGEESKYSLLPWNYELFSELGRYKIVISGDTEYTSPEFVINKKGIFKRSWEATFHKPLYNALIFLTNINPTHSFGVAIILLTLIIRLILLVPSQKALRSQKRMQEIQPKIQEIQKKYKGNQERISMETMALWKSAKVNPLGSCLPILLQFPVLIALYYSVREVAYGGSAYNLYAFQADFDFASINTMFLGILDLASKSLIVLPIIVGLLQFIQMRLTFAMKKEKNQPKQEKKKDGIPDMQAMNQTMSYTMPLMIAFFTASLPAGVGLYWGTSTLFSIGQSLVVNREKPESLNSSEVTVRVVEKTEEEKREEEKSKYLPGKKK